MVKERVSDVMEKNLKKENAMRRFIELAGGEDR
jgi:hypothetical protein